MAESNLTTGSLKMCGNRFDYSGLAGTVAAEKDDEGHLELEAES